jgi:alpha-beta hydrolase superfamily lysophospholipase
MNLFRYRNLCVALALACSLATASSAQSFVLPRRTVFGAAVTEAPNGVRITAIEPGSPATSAGLRLDDVLTAMGTHTLSTPADFVAVVHMTSISKPVAVTFLRNGIALHAKIKLALAPKEAEPEVVTDYSSIMVENTLRRTLETVGRHRSGASPALLLIGGIGCFTIDNPADLHDSYRGFAHDLTRAGIIVMRVEKAGIGDSQGGPCYATGFGEESRMYSAALDALLKDPRVDINRVFLFGHSIGSAIAPRLALQKRVAGIIIAEAVGINWFEYELANLRRQSELAGDSPEDTDELLLSKEVCMHKLLVDHQTEAAIEIDMPTCKKRNVYPVAPLYVQEVAGLNIAEPWTKVTMPVLAIYGTADFVTSESDHMRIVNIVNAHHAGNAELQLVQGMDHHLALMGTPENAYKIRVKEGGQANYAQELSVVVIKWIKDLAATRPANAPF